MKRRSLTPNEILQLCATLQRATLGALMASRRWERGDLAFQGGTCLHLAHGSPRFSEDLDFMVRGGMSLVGLEKAIERLLVLPDSLPPGLKRAVTLAKDDRNPHAFIVSLGGPDYLGSAKVKVELWTTPQAAMERLQLVVQPMTSPTGERFFLPVETLPEILADKVYALGARDRIKPRDIFDLWWLKNNNPSAAPMLSRDALQLRLMIYPNGAQDEAETAARWLEAAAKRLERLQEENMHELTGVVANDLSRWLPSSWGMNQADAAPMVIASRESLAEGIAVMTDIEAQLSAHKQGAPERCR